MKSTMSIGDATHPSSTKPIRRNIAGISLVVACALTPLTFAASAWDIVASGLDNPRDLDFAPNGALYIAEAGRGGNGPTIPGGGGGVLQFGLSGGVTRVFHGKQERVMS